MPVTEYPFSTFLRDPNDVTRQLEKGDVVLHRRGAPDLRLSLAERISEHEEGVALVSSLLRELHGEDLRVRLTEALIEATPWARFLPEVDQGDFAREFLTTLEACAAVENFAALGEVLHAWRSTAEIWSDPQLAKELGRPLPGDGRSVPRPRKR